MHVPEMIYQVNYGELGVAGPLSAAERLRAGASGVDGLEVEVVEVSCEQLVGVGSMES